MPVEQMNIALIFEIPLLAFEVVGPAVEHHSWPLLVFSRQAHRCEYTGADLCLSDGCKNYFHERPIALYLQ
jgi:hypothetical protein